MVTEESLDCNQWVTRHIKFDSELVDLSFVDLYPSYYLAKNLRKISFLHHAYFNK